MSEPKPLTNFGLVRTIGLTPENWQQISREIRGDKDIPMWIRALVSVFTSKPAKEALVAAEVVARLCRARALSSTPIERPLYDLSQPPSPINFAAVAKSSHKGPHGTEQAVTRLLLRRPSSPDRGTDPRTLGREVPSQGTPNRTLEDRRGERSAGDGAVEDPRTSPEAGSRSEFDNSTGPKPDNAA